jgi:hypothetical protein
MFPDFDYSISTLGGCPPTNRMTELVPRTFPDLNKCVALNKTRYDIKFLKKFDAIVINVLFGWYQPVELNLYTTYLRKSGIEKVIIFGGYYETKTEVPAIINQFGFDRSKVSEQIVPSIDTDQILQKTTNNLGYFYISKMKTFCTQTDCPFWHSNIPFTWDNHHLSYEFAIRLLSGQRDQIKDYLNMNNSS